MSGKSILVYFCLVSLPLFMSCTSKKAVPNSKFYNENLPAFDILLMDSMTHINTGSLPKGTPKVLILFSPLCPYCKKETRMLIQNEKQFRDINMYFISSFSFSSIKDFYSNFSLNNYPNFFVGQDTTEFIKRHYTVTQIPYFAFFDRENKLIGIAIGGIKLKNFSDIIDKARRKG